MPGGLVIQNPAFFEPSANRVVCGSDIQKLGDDLAKSRINAKQDLDEIANEEAKIIRLFGKTPELARHLKPYKANSIANRGRGPHQRCGVRAGHQATLSNALSRGVPRIRRLLCLSADRNGRVEFAGRVAALVERGDGSGL